MLRTVIVPGCIAPARYPTEGVPMPRKAAPWWRSAAGRWYVRHNGRQTPLSVTDRNDQAAAFAAFQRLLEQAKSTPASRPEPIALLVSEYLDSISHRIAPKTRVDYGIHLKRLVARFPSSAAGQLDPSTLEKSADPAWSDSHKSNYLWTVQAFLRWCGRKDLRLQRPAKESRGADSVISPEVHARVLRETTGDFHQLIRFLWATGCRPMEGAGLTFEAIDWAGGTATLTRHKTKRKGKSRVLYFGADALAILNEQSGRHNNTGHVFRGAGDRPLSRQALVTRFIRVSDKVGKAVRAYDYRHTYVTRSLEKGVPDAMVAALVGHSSTAMIHKFYSHVGANAKLLREAAERAAG